jgi:hypothetical protein
MFSRFPLLIINCYSSPYSSRCVIVNLRTSFLLVVVFFTSLYHQRLTHLKVAVVQVRSLVDWLILITTSFDVDGWSTRANHQTCP